MQHANIHLRESRSLLSVLADSDPLAADQNPFHPLTAQDINELEQEITADSLTFKNDWFAYNGGSVGDAKKEYKKPLFFDIALNYVQLDMDRLQERAGKAPEPKTQAQPQAKTPVAQPVPEKKMLAKAKAEEIVRAPTPEPTTPSRAGGLSSLLGGWWGRS